LRRRGLSSISRGRRRSFNVTSLRGNVSWRPGNVTCFLSKFLSIFTSRGRASAVVWGRGKSTVLGRGRRLVSILRRRRWKSLSKDLKS
jgi:hypothetical protein